MLKPVQDYLSSIGYNKQATELGFFNYRLDIFGCSSNRKSIAVELKLKKWKRALEQSRVYQLCSDFVYMALPSCAINRIDMPLLESNGVGLIEVTPTKCTVVLKAKQSSVIIQDYSDWCMEDLDRFQNSKECNDN